MNPNAAGIAVAEAAATVHETRYVIWITWTLLPLTFAEVRSILIARRDLVSPVARPPLAATINNSLKAN